MSSLILIQLIHTWFSFFQVADIVWDLLHGWRLESTDSSLPLDLGSIPGVAVSDIATSPSRLIDLVSTSLLNTCWCNID